ncbi:hypothetical protein BCR34DRAFT_32321 [Clohesyomyces aquaticus]|uniref:HTH La-type RNA-binding domain-containing protein n=1 Tax=Clohesyomyces aquaticus TaxID=1231657 RepID=A0A1Y1Z971_9PLEO|nr:hypothetical protein BCR34DRAFT_32321 [Clohesyomyces aquaticus]
MAATPVRRSGSDLSSPPVPFSYAQAAKGLSSTAASAAASSKPASGAITPSKDATPAVSTTPSAAALNWADDTEVGDFSPRKPSIAQDVQATGMAAPAKPAAPQEPLTTSSVSSPDLAGSSSSTAIKDDDVSSIQNPSSESTWENKSQASTSVDKSTDSGEQAADTIKAKDQDRSSFKPLQEAPVPVVNIWKQRAEEIAAKAKGIQKPVVPRPNPTSSAPAITNGVPQGPNPTAAKKGKNNVAVESIETREKGNLNEAKAKTRDEDRNGHGRKESRLDAETEKPKKGTKARTLEKEVTKPVANPLPLPPTRDQESWPTPDSAIDENKKKVQEKGDKGEKERNTSTSVGSHGKKEWVTVPYTPTVIFNTPLPNTAPGRRGGRGGGRGGAQSGGRGNAYSSANGGSTEKETPTPSALPNGEQPKRGRSDGPTMRDTSPTKAKRTVSAGSSSLKDAKATPVSAEKMTKAVPASESETPSRRNSVMTETAPGSQPSGQNNTYPRQVTSSRSNKGRRGDLPTQGDRRKDIDLASPTKDNTSSYGRTDVEDPDRRESAFQDGQNGQSKTGANERRPFGSFSGRGRERGVPRGARGSYQSGGHQFGNGHMPLQQSAPFQLPRSPTTFHPDQANFYPQHSRSYRGNGPRSQSMTTENMYGRVPGYGATHPGIPPISTFMNPGMYEYSTIPLSAPPFSPFSVDQYTLIAMVTTQLEYYFSVENLCKDIFLRKHMDSKGFVYLGVIAEFNRIKQLTTDMELIRHVCYQSRVIEFVVGKDGKDRLRRREGWEQWVLAKPERDASAQNDGPDELHNPPIPHPAGFDQPGIPRYPDASAVSPTGPVPLANDGTYPGINGAQHSGSSTAATLVDSTLNGHVVEGLNGSVTPNGQPIETSARTVNGELDSFSDEQVETLSVIVRKQDQPSAPSLPPSATRTFSHGSIDSRSGVPDETDRLSSQLSSPKVNGTGPSQG